ncbi:MAG: hypothetical protein LAO78_19505 [Acidobacteriia bacterium]|nr:hypothetical protein [Terriglobia bacterium]
MRKFSPSSKIFIVAVVTIGAAVLVKGLIDWKASKPFEFLALLSMTVIASRLRVKLPGINGTMSVNVPFLLIVAVQLSSSQALAIAALASLVQSMPSTQWRTAPVQAIFNSATITNAVAAAALAFGFASQRGLVLPLSIAAAGIAFFFANTLPIAVVLWLAEGAAPVKTWRAMARLSIPYYALSAGVAAVVCAATQFAVWGLSLALLPFMYFIYTSYRLYFADRTVAEVQPVEAKPMARAVASVSSAFGMTPSDTASGEAASERRTS